MSAGNPEGTKYERYIDAIQTGVIPSCKWVKLAVERQLNDLKRAELPDFPYYFDTAAADRIIKFASLARLTSGEWRLKQKRFDLEDWQGFILSCVFGWKHKETGYRRFTRVYEEIARKNGKTEKAGLVMNYCLYEGAGEDAAQVFSAATTKDQARIAFKAAQSMARGFSSDGYAWAKYTQALTHVVLLGESSMKALSSEDNFLDWTALDPKLISRVYISGSSKYRPPAFGVPSTRYSVYKFIFASLTAEGSTKETSPPHAI